MDREIWQATVHRVVRVTHDLVTKPPCVEDPYMQGWTPFLPSGILFSSRLEI